MCDSLHHTAHILYLWNLKPPLMLEEDLKSASVSGNDEPLQALITYCLDCAWKGTLNVRSCDHLNSLKKTVRSRNFIICLHYTLLVFQHLALHQANLLFFP